MASKRKRDSDDGSLDFASEEEVQGLLSNLRNVFGEAFAEKTSREVAALEHLNVGLKSKVKGLENGLRVTKADHLTCREQLQEQSSLLKNLQQEYNMLLGKVSEPSSASSSNNNAVLKAELVSLEEIVARLKGENAALISQVSQLQQQLTTAKTNSELNMDEAAVKHRRLQSENARLQASLESATSREDKLKQAHRSTHELNIKLMDDITVLNDRGAEVQLQVDTLREDGEMKDRRIKRLEHLLRLATPLEKVATSGIHMVISEPNQAVATSGFVGESEVLGAMSLDQTASVTVVNPQHDAGHQILPAPALSAAHHTITSSDTESISSAVDGIAEAPSKHTSLVLTAQQDASLATTQSARIATINSASVDTKPANEVIVPPAMTVQTNAENTTAWYSFMINTAPNTVSHTGLENCAEKTGGMVAFKPRKGGIEFYVEYLTPEDAARAWALLNGTRLHDVVLRCRHSVTGTRKPNLDATRTVIVYCESTVDDVMYTAGSYGAVSYFAYAVSMHARFVVEYERNAFAELALKNPIKFSRDGREFQCETYYAPSPHQEQRAIVHQAQASSSSNILAPVPALKKSNKVSQAPKRLCQLCRDAKRPESIVHSHYAQDCGFTKGFKR